MHVPINYLAVVAAAAAGYVLSYVWYWLASTVWAKARGQSRKRQEPPLEPFVIAAVAYLLMAWILAGLLGHLGNVTVRGGIISAFIVWAGFILTTTAVNQTFRNERATATLIDVGNWLAVLLAMGAVIGAFGV